VWATTTQKKVLRLVGVFPIRGTVHLGGNSYTCYFVKMFAEMCCTVMTYRHTWGCMKRTAGFASSDVNTSYLVW